MVVSFVHWIDVEAKPSYPSTKPKSGVSPTRAREVGIERGKVKFLDASDACGNEF